uniref:TATA box binding protein (TBP)-associated factor, RNA polymerase I, A n=1 Tax=Astyanax mexicanus TaxID=7994 RepID=A0A8B9HXV2_ASTMX
MLQHLNWVKVRILQKDFFFPLKPTKMLACARDFCTSLADTLGFFLTSLIILRCALAVIFTGRPLSSVFFNPQIIWRLGTEILQHHPNSRLEDFNALYEQMKNSGVKNYAKICLEHSFHLLLNGHIYDAKRQLSVAASWRYGKQSVPQSLDLKLIHAYCGFLDYVIWHMKKSSVSEAGKKDNSSNREMHSYFRQASVTLQEIIAQPGVWDPFVLSYVDMLEFYNDQEEALKVLQNYAYNKDYPSNPNAHVYLYQFLKRHEAPPAKLISILKVRQRMEAKKRLLADYAL